MKHAEFRFYAGLNRFLPPSRRGRAFLVPIHGKPAIRDLIADLGVDRTEVELVLVDGEPVGLDRIVDDGERVSVYPAFGSIDVSAPDRT
jgi:hypothetical protein